MRLIRERRHRGAQSAYTARLLLLFPSFTSSAKEIAASLWEKEFPSQWEDVLNTNVTAVYFTTLAFLPLLQGQTTSRPDTNNQDEDNQDQIKQHKHNYKQNDNKNTKQPGNIITTSLMSGLIRRSQGHFSYNTAKAATNHLTKMMSTEFSKTGIRIKSIGPGYFPSEMTTGGSDGRQKKSVMGDEDVKRKGHAVPAGRAGRDEEMAMAYLFHHPEIDATHTHCHVTLRHV